MIKIEPTLDNKDLKILFELDKNSRISISSLAKKLRISREIIKYRIKKLTSEGIIRSFTTITNPSKFGYLIYKVYLKFQNFTREKEEKLTKYILANKNIFWIAKCDGSFDLILGVYVSNLMEFNNILLDFMSKFSQNILSRHISNSVYVDIYRREYLNHNKSEKVTWGGEFSEEKLDNLMKEILKMIAKDSRTSIVDLAYKLKSTPKTIISKIKEMEKKQIILGYRIDLDLKKIKREYFKAIIYFRNITHEKEEEFKTYCQNNPDIAYYIKTIAEWDAELDIEIENFNNFTKLIREIKENFGDIIKTIDTVFISEEMKGELNIVQNL